MTNDITRDDLVILNNAIKSVYDTTRSESVGLNGLDFLESWCHEMAHLMDLGYSADDAADTAQDVRDVVDAMNERIEGTKAKDNNEVNASAIVICALKCVEGYDPSTSVSNCHGNVSNVDRVVGQDLVNKALQHPRNITLAKQLQRFLLELLYEGRMNADANN